MADRPQVFDDGGFADRLGVARRHVGTGFTLAEVQELSRTVDLNALLRYWDAVTTRTSEVIAGLADSDYDRIVIETVREASTPDGAYRDSRTSAWLDGFFAEKSVGWFAMFLPVHLSEHLGEALAIRGPLGLSIGV